MAKDLKDLEAQIRGLERPAQEVFDRVRTLLDQ